tara:strand:- start:5291 stop:5941 length:651 start_codon:yes stop_codon:yes gene_type:complete
MNKLKLMAVSALALATAGANASNFDGMYAGVRADYNMDKQEAKDSSGDKTNFKAKGMGGSILFGYMNDLGNDMVIGAELIAGYQNAKDKKETTKSGSALKGTYNNKFNFGADFLAGYKFMPELLGYGRLGLHMHQSDFRLDITKAGSTETNKKTQYVPNVHVGLGAKYAIDESFVLDAGYTFAYDLKDKTYGSDTKKATFKKSGGHQIHVGVSYVF